MSKLIADKFAAWQQECDDRFNQLKANEEELNRIFIDIYGLQDELTPEVEDKDVTVRKADLTREIKSLISYAVGCMFGRYSLECDGLIYAGGNFEDVYELYRPTYGDMMNQYATYDDLKKVATYGQLASQRYYLRDIDAKMADRFSVDADNIIPITDTGYFFDDIVVRFIEFVQTVYGTETLEENLDFIAAALGNKGKTSREVIRNYFLKDFYKDHLKTYQKRPIYWLFDSGKLDGFKALIYLHRYDADTPGRVRADYLHKQQGFLESAIERCDYTLLQESANPRDKATATKEKDKLIKQLAETRIYDQALAHIALQRLPLDLDDGVKVNYAKFQGIEVAREGQKTVKIDLLGKI